MIQQTCHNMNIHHHQNMTSDLVLYFPSSYQCSKDPHSERFLCKNFVCISYLGYTYFNLHVTNIILDAAESPIQTIRIGLMIQLHCIMQMKLFHRKYITMHGDTNNYFHMQ
jgi:hypothetical protein